MEADQTHIDTDTNEPSFRERIDALPRNLLLAILAFLVIVLCLIFAAIYYAQVQARTLKPERIPPTPNQIIVDGNPIVVTFEELNTNATEYQNKWIQVTGNYFPQDPTICNPQPSNGPKFNSVLVSEGLQLNIQGGEKALAIIPVNTEMVVQGVWRLYSGPAGCGKEPPSDVIWYLDIRAIVQPNPIVGGTPASPIDATLSPELPPPGSENTPTPGVDQSIPTPTNTPIPVTVVVETPVVTNTVTPDPFATPTVALTPTATPTNGTFTRTSTPNPNATATLAVTGTATATATATTTGTPGTAVPTNTPITIPTATQSGGYPGNTPSPTITPGNYP